MSQKVLVVDDDEVLRESLAGNIASHGFIVVQAKDGEEAIQKTYADNFDLILMDVNMPKVSGLSALKAIKAFDPTITIIMLTAFSQVSDAVQAVKEGAYNYLEKPIPADSLVSLIKRALKAKSLVEVSAFSAPTLMVAPSSGAEQFVGESSEMKKIFEVITKLARVTTPVLIRGESGTGKELVAKAIHFNGPRKDQKFVSINCAAIPEGLIESELFGHEKGAFTGANERKIGRFQYADGGTLFLDEIGDLSMPLQAKLLRAIQEKTFTPLGSNREVTVDIRIIAASHQDFDEKIKKNEFREDLFYRLNVLPVYLPPLRNRKTDIPVLVKYYLNYFNRLHGLQVKAVAEDALSAFKKYAWPGNIRELRNVLEHAFIMESGDTLKLASFPKQIQLAQENFTTLPEEVVHEEADEATIDIEEIQQNILKDDKSTTSPQFDFHFHEGVPLDYSQAKDYFEKSFIEYALKLNKGKINQTAIKCNIPKKTLLRKIEKYKLNPKNLVNQSGELI